MIHGKALVCKIQSIQYWVACLLWTFQVRTLFHENEDLNWSWPVTQSSYKSKLTGENANQPVNVMVVGPRGSDVWLLKHLEKALHYEKRTVLVGPNAFWTLSTGGLPSCILPMQRSAISFWYDQIVYSKSQSRFSTTLLFFVASNVENAKSRGFGGWRFSRPHTFPTSSTSGCPSSLTMP